MLSSLPECFGSEFHLAGVVLEPEKTFMNDIDPVVRAGRDPGFDGFAIADGNTVPFILLQRLRTALCALSQRG